ncbi:MAG: hypothetical protein GC200_12720 [Tepidisphaera sp.]|nr:hypothetical protein [Tepidisphaera sp.]
MNQVQTGLIVSAAALSALTGIANADFFSFASDIAGASPTFQGVPTDPPGSGGIADAGPLSPSGRVNTMLLWDPDNDGPQPAMAFASYMTFQAGLSQPLLTPFAGGFIQSWVANGQYEFHDAANDSLILRVTFSNAAFISFTDNPNFLGSSATLQSSEVTDGGLTFTGFGPLAGRNLSGPRSQAFTLTALRGPNGQRAGVAQGGFVLPGWVSEGSWSANAVPAPGALALGGLGGLLVFRRSRGSK